MAELNVVQVWWDLGHDSVTEEEMKAWLRTMQEIAQATHPEDFIGESDAAGAVAAQEDGAVVEDK